MIHLGFEIGTGTPVSVPLKHLAVAGQTQESGKTTTLEALVSRAGVPAIAFVTKRGESSFAGGRRIQPYFRDRADWQFVDALLEAQLREKNKFLRPWIIRICRGTRTLADVHAEVRKGLKKAKGISEGVYTQLDAYLELIVPQIAQARLAPAIALAPGLNVMDLSGYSAPLQMLFVQSAIDWVNEREQGVITIIPEAWEFIPEGRGSPVKASAVALVRKGAGIKNFIWVDSQDMAGVAKEILRGCTVWLIGAQREANEIKRNLSNIPADIAKPKAGDIARLEQGQFFACWKGSIHKVYVQPAWLPEHLAHQVALGKLTAADAVACRPVQPNRPQPQKEGTVPDEKDIVERLAVALEKRLGVVPAAGNESLPAKVPAAEQPSTPGHAVDEEVLYQRFKSRLIKEAPALLCVLAAGPELEVTIERQVLDVNGSTLRGRLALMIADGYFDTARPGADAFKELGRNGFSTANPNVYRELKELAALGFLTSEADGYKAVPDMKKSIRKRGSRADAAAG